MRAVDTNVLVRLFVADDAKQTERAFHFIGTGAWVSHLVLTETIWVLSSFYSLNRASLVRGIETVLSNKSLALQERDVVADALELFREHKGVDFSDCLIMSTARKNGHTPLGTFDAKLARIDGATLL
jgi:predicted nucleic-acid-binding protein